MHPFPAFDLRIHAPGLTLRLPTDDELAALALKAQGNVLQPHERTLLGEWTQLGPGEFERNFLQYHWSARAGMGPALWAIEFGVFPDDESAPVGIIGLSARDFAIRRSVDTGSWLLPAWRGRGLGKQMRAGALCLAFEHLDATRARSTAVPSNRASHGVSAGLGYERDGTDTDVAFGEPVEVVRLLLTRERYTPRPDITVTGLDRLRALLGA